MAGALDGFRIIDATQVISGPLATRILADQGADVIKVESPKGDTLRHMGGISGLAPTFTTINRSKRSLVLDLKKEGALPILDRLVAGADVFIQNSRPGAADRVGYGFERLSALNPRLVYVSISGFGPEGPYAHKRVYDPLIQGMSTLAEIQGYGTDRPRLIRVIVPDKVTALTAAQAMTAALLARERTGRGQHIEISMLDSVLSFVWPEGMAYHTFVSPDRPKAKPVARRDLVYATLDGHIMISTVAHREWVAFCEAAEKPEWLEDPRFQDTSGLVRHAKERLDMMGEVVATRPSAHWLRVLDDADVPCAPVLSRDDVHLHPQVIENGIIVEDEHPVVGLMRQTRPPERMHDTPSEIRRPAPLLGQHTREVLDECGVRGAELDALFESGVVAEPAATPSRPKAGR